MPELTKQQKSPHPRLVECRNAVASALDLPKGANVRREAAAICNHLTDDQVEDVLDANGDTKKILDAIKPVLVPTDRDEVMKSVDGVSHKHKGKTANKKD